MNKFSDFNIDPFEGKHIFSVPVISVEDVVNCEIEVIDFEANVKTRHGDGRYIVKVLFEGSEKKFFTNATPIKEALSKIPKTDFPFMATIKQQKFGTGKTFYFS